MQRIAGDKSLSQSKAMVGKARSLVASYGEKALANIETARADIDKLQMSEGARAGFRKGFEKSLETSRGRLLEQLDLEARIVDEVGKMFDLLSAKSGVWAIRGGKIVFSEQATLSNIAEALSATAIGLLVAIPAVIAFNFFSRRVRVIMGGADEVAHAVLSLVHGAERGGRTIPYKEAGDGGE